MLSVLDMMARQLHLSGTLNAAKGQYETLQWTVIKHIELSITNSKPKVQYGGNLITLDLFLLSC